jgi:VCBS repeat-containing protein
MRPGRRPHCNRIRSQACQAAGDVIVDVDGETVSTPGDVKSKIAAAQQAGKKAVMMRVQTADGSDRFVAFAFPKAG